MPTEREKLPCVRYRVTVELPCVVAFPSATYRTELCYCSPSGRYYLSGYNHAQAVEALMSPNYRSREALVVAVFQAGFPVRVDTIGATILRKMGRQGWAVVVC